MTPLNIGTRDVDMNSPDDKELDDADRRTDWQTKRERIQEILAKHQMKVKMPTIYTTLPEGMLSDTFADDQIKRYEVYENKDESVTIRAIPKDDDPFILTIKNRKVEGINDANRKYILHGFKPTTSHNTSSDVGLVRHRIGTIVPHDELPTATGPEGDTPDTPQTKDGHSKKDAA